MKTLEAVVELASLQVTAHIKYFSNHHQMKMAKKRLDFFVMISIIFLEAFLGQICSWF